ncbi:hypothetical protein HK096_008438 [Nowakowskiella sp. JEL0078]|nr:hypothetical protein HK096_008438 [Nowakowskiella sp. JEL0078]
MFQTMLGVLSCLLLLRASALPQAVSVVQGTCADPVGVLVGKSIGSIVPRNVSDIANQCECLASCTSSCDFSVWNSVSKVCSLYVTEKVDKEFFVTIFKNYTTEIKGDIPKQSLDPPANDLSGKGYNYTLSECLSNCNKNSSCDFVNYNKSNSNCYLKSADNASNSVILFHLNTSNSFSYQPTPNTAGISASPPITPPHVHAEDQASLTPTTLIAIIVPVVAVFVLILVIATTIVIRRKRTRHMAVPTPITAKSSPPISTGNYSPVPWTEDVVVASAVSSIVDVMPRQPDGGSQPVVRGNDVLATIKVTGTAVPLDIPFTETSIPRRTSSKRVSRTLDDQATKVMSYSTLPSVPPLPVVAEGRAAQANTFVWDQRIPLVRNGVAACYMVITPYSPVQEDEIEVRRSDVVQPVHVFPDGWFRIMNLTTGLSGMAPCLSILDAHGAPVEVQLMNH